MFLYSRRKSTDSDIRFCFLGFLGNLGKNHGKITAFYPFIKAVDW